MKRTLALAVLILSVLSVGKLRAAPAVTETGSTSSGTVTIVNVSSNVSVLLSTGMNFAFFGESTNQIFFPDRSSSTITSPGQTMPGRKTIEIFNDSGVDIWIGYSASVSTWPGTTNLGRRVPTGTSWSHNCSIPVHYAVANSSTGFGVVVTQEK